LNKTCETSAQYFYTWSFLLVTKASLEATIEELGVFDETSRAELGSLTPGILTGKLTLPGARHTLPRGATLY